MDQLTAYKILGLSPDSSPEEIKEAYATLSKQYHPEEEPEKFQEIHEAYVTLTRRKRRGSAPSTDNEPLNVSIMQTKQPEQQYEQKKPVINKEDFDRIEMERDTQKQPEYAFDDALKKANQEEQEKSYVLVLEAVAELKILTSPKYKNHLKEYKSFFHDKKYESIIRRADFLEKLCDILEETKLSKNIYAYIIDFYRLRGMKPSDLSPIGLRLYQILDERAGMKKVNPGVYGGVAVGFGVGLRALRPILQQSEVLSAIVLGIVAVFILICVAKKLHEKHSALFTQAVAAVILAISQFVVIMFDLYGTIFGTVDDGNSVAAVIFLLALLWLAIVIVVAVIKAIIGCFR